METFFRKYWEEGNIIYYLHFVDDYAVRQIEINEDKIVCMDEENPVNNDSFLYDQKLSDLDYGEKDVISKKEFELIFRKLCYGKLS